MLSLELAPCAASGDKVIAAAQNGRIVGLAEWRVPRAGDFIYNPAGMIHALGAGLNVLEIQRAVDLTYRLFDYGRGRELRPENSRNVVEGRPHRHPLDRRVGEESTLLVVGPHFGVAWCVDGPPVLPPRMRDVQLIPIDAAVRAISPGECALIDTDTAQTRRSDGKFVLAWSVP